MNANTNAVAVERLDVCTTVQALYYITHRYVCQSLAVCVKPVYGTGSATLSNLQQGEPG